MSLKDKRDAENGGSSAGATGTAGGQSMKKGCGNCIFELGERVGRTSRQPPAIQAGGTEWEEVRGRRTSHKYSKGKPDGVQGIMAALTGAVFRDGTSREVEQSLTLETLRIHADKVHSYPCFETEVRPELPSNPNIYMKPS